MQAFDIVERKGDNFYYLVHCLKDDDVIVRLFDPHDFLPYGRPLQIAQVEVVRCNRILSEKLKKQIENGEIKTHLPCWQADATKTYERKLNVFRRYKRKKSDKVVPNNSIQQAA